MSSAPKTNKPLNTAEAAYIAGLIDGEGSIGLLRKHRGENRQLVVSISNNDFALLRYVLDVTGVGKITSKKPAKIKHTPSKTYTVTNRQALELLRQITPMLRTYKRARAELILEKYLTLTPRNGKYSAELLAARNNFVEECMSIKP